MAKPLNIFILFIFLFSSYLFAQDFAINAEIVERQILISFTIPEKYKDNNLVIFRSTTDISSVNIDKTDYPITEFKPNLEQTTPVFIDSLVADNTTYFYKAMIAVDSISVIFSNIAIITIPNIDIPELNNPKIVIDKKHYLLEVRNNGRIIKRYPIALGRDSVNRKLHQDNSTTPEGLYIIYNMQPKATYYKAFDINYPNAIDRIRFDFMREINQVPEGRRIGGEIQIHGMGIDNNWTWGCIALRNSDIDELFSRITCGTSVIIIGNDITGEDISSISKTRSQDEIRTIQNRLIDLGFDAGAVDGILGRGTRYAIGRFQRANGFPVTCDLDMRTVDILLVD